MINHLALIHQASGANDVEVEHFVVLEVAQYAGRVVAALNRLDCRQPELAHLDNAAVREAEMFRCSVSDAALADLCRGVLAVDRSHALEAGRIDAAVLDSALSRRLASKGFTQLIDLAKTDASFPGLGLGVTRAYLDQQPATLEKVVSALTEGLAFVQLPANKPVVLKILMKQLRLTNAHG